MEITSFERQKYLTPNYCFTVSGPEQLDQPGHRAAAPHHLQAGGARQPVRLPHRSVWHIELSTNLREVSLYPEKAPTAIVLTPGPV